MKFLVIEGNVVGGHRIEDIGLDVPYQEEVRIQSDRASWSSDLAYAIEKGLVTKKRIYNATRERRHAARQSSEQQTRKPPPMKETSDDQDDFQEKADRKPHAESDSKENTSDTSSEINELTSMNKQLMEKMDQMMERMGEMISQEGNSSEGSVSKEELDVLMDRITEKVSNSSSVRSKQTSSENETEEEVHFIPSDIRSDEVEASDDIEVEEDSAEGSSIDKAAEALSKMKQEDS